MKGARNIDPVDRNAVMTEGIVWTASEALPVKADVQPRPIIPTAVQYNAPFSSANATSSSMSAVAVA